MKQNYGKPNLLCSVFGGIQYEQGKQMQNQLHADMAAL